MIEKAIPLTLPPGVFRNGTKYQAKNRWYDANGVRWYEGIMGPIGGWRNVAAQVDGGIALGAQTSTTLKDTTKVWTVNQWAGRTVTIVGGLGAGQTRTIASNTVDTLTVSVAWGTTPDGTSTYQINGLSLQVTGKPRAAHGWRDNAAVSHMAVGTHSKLMLYTDGALTDITPAGFPGSPLPDGKFVAGNFGSGAFGVGPYGTGSGALTLNAPSTWTLDNFGELLVGCHTTDGRLLQASPNGGIATVLTNAPVANTGIVVTPEHFVVALGAGGIARRVQWPDQESLTLWTPATTNQAGAFDLPTKGRLVTGRRTRRQTILWTDVDVYAMTYVGGIGIYNFEQLGDNCGIIGPQASVVLGDRMFWMSYGKFFEYDGALKPLDCDVLDLVFGQLDQSQRAKVQALPMTLFNEVWWTYPSKGRSTYENDKFVGYNFEEQHWIIGDLPRACGIDRGVFEYPVLLDPDGFIYEHEYGSNRTGMTVFAESGPLELGEGDQLLRVQQVIPDEKTLGDVRMTLFGAFYPTAVEKVVGPFTASNPTPTRLTARQVRLRVDEVTATDWRVGVPRLGVLPAGNR